MHKLEEHLVWIAAIHRSMYAHQGCSSDICTSKRKDLQTQRTCTMPDNQPQTQLLWLQLSF